MKCVYKLIMNINNNFKKYISKKISLLLLLSFIILFTAENNAYPVTSLVVDDNGKKIWLTNIQIIDEDECKNSYYYTDTQTETKIFHDYIRVDSHLGTINIPFNLIKQIYTESIKKKYRTIKKYNLILWDGTEINDMSKISSTIIGNSNNRIIKLAAYELNEIIFKGKPVLFHEAQKKGNRAITIVYPDGTELGLTGCAFMEEKTNKNGCIIGYNYNEVLEILIKQIIDNKEFWFTKRITWDEIKEITFIKDKKESRMMKITSVDGQEITGQAISRIPCIIGIGKVGSYTLEIAATFLHYNGYFPIQKIIFPVKNLSETIQKKSSGNE